MEKDKYLEILNKIDELRAIYENLEEDADYDMHVEAIRNVVKKLQLKDVKIILSKPKTGESVSSFVVLDSEYESPNIYEIPDDSYFEVTEFLYQLITSYRLSSDFYDNVGIDFDTILALMINYNGLRISGIKNKNVFTNNVDQWKRFPCYDSLKEIARGKKQFYSKH